MWPTQSDYKDALSRPDVAFRNPDLQQSGAERSPMGVPKARSGAFASVYKLTGPAGTVALKLFNFPDEDRERRQKAVSDYLHQLGPKRPACLVKFRYELEGIRIGKAWYPILTMDWVKGTSLGEWVRQQMEKKPPNVEAVRKMSEQWAATVRQLQEAKVAHGCLQHDNVMVVGDAPVLVDYDSMCVPALDPADPAKKLDQLEFGKPAYEHPGRATEKLGLHLDHFAAWAVFVALRAIAADPQLYDRHVLKTENENLLFTPKDMRSPESSQLWPDLLKCKDADVSRWAKALRESLDKPFANIPPFAPNLPAPAPAPAAPKAAPVAPPAAPVPPPITIKSPPVVPPAPAVAIKSPPPPAAAPRVSPPVPPQPAPAVAAPPTPARKFAVGDAVPGLSSWSLERQLGSSGVGEVWLAKHAGTDERRAVKFCTDADAKARLAAHVKAILRAMKPTLNHPNVVPLLECNLDGDSPWLMYEHVEVGTLADAIGRWKSAPPEERLAKSVRALRAIAGAVGRFHQLNPPVAHRDLSAQSVLMAGEAPRVGDIGLGAVAVEAEIARLARTKVASAAGPRPHAPPEQLRGAGATAREDVFALGVLAFQMLLGEPKRAPGSDAADLLRAQKVPAELVSLIVASLSDDPARRPKDATEWDAALKPLAPSPPAAPAPPLSGAQPKPAPRPSPTSPPVAPAPSSSQSALNPAVKPTAGMGAIAVGTFLVDCPKCGKRLVVPKASAGKQIKCAHCATAIILPT